MTDRIAEITKHIPRDGIGLEIAPLFRPTLTKPNYNIHYTDYLSTERLRRRERNHPDAHKIVDIDFVWKPSKKLKQCCREAVYDYVVASHVWEHVPNPIGWLQQVLSVCRVGAVVSLALPLKSNPIDATRRETGLSELVAAYLQDQKHPSCLQVFDCLYNARGVPENHDHEGNALEDYVAMPRQSTGNIAMRKALRSRYMYIDVHCSVFSPDTLGDLLNEIVELGLLDIEVVEVKAITQNNEIYVHMKKTMPVGNGVSPLVLLHRQATRDYLKQVIYDCLGHDLYVRLKKALLKFR